MLSEVSPLDPRPYINTGRELRRKPLRVQVLALGALAAFWIALAVTLHRWWPAVVAAASVFAMGIRVVQVRREGNTQ